MYKYINKLPMWLFIIVVLLIFGVEATILFLVVKFALESGWGVALLIFLVLLFWWIDVNKENR